MNPSVKFCTLAGAMAEPAGSFLGYESHTRAPSLEPTPQAMVQRSQKANSVKRLICLCVSGQHGHDNLNDDPIHTTDQHDRMSEKQTDRYASSTAPSNEHDTHTNTDWNARLNRSVAHVLNTEPMQERERGSA